jgi:hypothetical protein
VSLGSVMSVMFSSSALKRLNKVRGPSRSLLEGKATEA